MLFLFSTASAPKSFAGPKEREKIQKIWKWTKRATWATWISAILSMGTAEAIDQRWILEPKIEKPEFLNGKTQLGPLHDPSAMTAEKRAYLESEEFKRSARTVFLVPAHFVDFSSDQKLRTSVFTRVGVGGEFMLLEEENFDFFLSYVVNQHCERSFFDLLHRDLLGYIVHSDKPVALKAMHTYVKFLSRAKAWGFRLDAIIDDFYDSYIQTWNYYNRYMYDRLQKIHFKFNRELPSYIDRYLEGSPTQSGFTLDPQKRAVGQRYAVISYCKDLLRASYRGVNLENAAKIRRIQSRVKRLNEILDKEFGYPAK